MRRLLCLPLLAWLATAQTVPSGRGAAVSNSRFSEPVLNHRVEPDYSPEARDANYEGTLTVYLEVDSEGNPADLRVIQGLGMGLDERALEAVRRWRFKPATLNGEAVKTALSAELRFRLDPGGVWRVPHTAFTVIREDRGKSERTEKPVLSHYTSPAAGVCATGGGPVVIQFDVD